MSREHKQFRALLASYVEAVAAWRRAEDEGGAIISSWTNIANRLPLIEAAAADPRVRDARGRERRARLFFAARVTPARAPSSHRPSSPIAHTQRLGALSRHARGRELARLLVCQHVAEQARAARRASATRARSRVFAPERARALPRRSGSRRTCAR